jgi:hypothetical protein
MDTRCAVHVSALIDGIEDPGVCVLASGDASVMAHLWVGFTGYHYEHLGVVRGDRPQARYRTFRVQGLHLYPPPERRISVWKGWIVRG